MPSLDDLSILAQHIALAADDLVPISDSDSKASSRVKQVPVALIGEGFTHAFVVNYDNAEVAGESVNDTDELVSLMSIPQNSIVSKVRAIVTTAFAGTTALNIFVGRGGTGADDNGYIASFSGLAKGAKQNTGELIDTALEIDVVTASDATLDITFDPAANGEALADLTAGQVVVLAAITEIADYADLVPATA